MKLSRDQWVAFGITVVGGILVVVTQLFLDKNVWRSGEPEKLLSGVPADPAQFTMDHLSLVLDGAPKKVYRGDEETVNLLSILRFQYGFPMEFLADLECHFKYGAVEGLSVEETKECVFRLVAIEVNGEGSSLIAPSKLRICQNSTGECREDDFDLVVVD